tara:strand:- start:508 stop:1434 length:927 start_codon:yes stop_codon:yes gene_type:complete
MELIKLIKLHTKSFLLIFSLGLNAQEKSLFVLHTNNTNGALENCYCPDNPFGSVEKRSMYINDFIKKNPNTIVVDAGDIFTMGKQFLKDSLMAEAYNLLPYDAILFGDQEITMESNILSELRKIIDTPLVSTNFDLEGSFRSIVINKAGLKIALLGIIDEYVIKYYPKEVKDRIKIQDPIEELKKEISKLKSDVDIIILLTHQGLDLDIALAKEIKDIDLIVGSHSQSLIESPTQVNGALIVQAGKSGYQVGVAKLLIKNNKVVNSSGRVDTMKIEMSDDPRIIKMIKEYEDRTGRINRRKLKMMKKQ